MNQERWQRITGIFEAALKREPESRAAFVAAACTADDDLRQEVEAMLSSHERAGGFIESPAMEVAARQSGDGKSLIGQTIAHYQVLSLLGSGGMGDVYLALDTKLGRRVALKLLPEYLAGDSPRARMFTKEARAASALNHPNIITIHEIGQLGARYYIAMEYIEGETLGEKIHRKRAPLNKLLKYLQQVAEGLTKAHAAGIIHRDLKPDNIMITSDGYAKILDFGLAKLVEQPPRPGAAEPSEANTALMSPTSIPGMVMGTLGYMSPEQAQGKSGEIDHRSDIFSFGCILYEAATSQRAFEGKDVLDSLHKIVHAPTPSLLDISPNAPQELERIVRRCLAKDPEKRYQSIKDVVIELEEFREGLKDHPELTGQGSIAASRHPVNTDATASFTASTAKQTTPPTSSAEYLVGEIKRHKRGVAIALGVAVLVLAGLAFGIYKFWPRRFSAVKLTRLTNSGNASRAAVSPDGKFIAYVVTEAGQQSIRLSLVDNPASTTVIVPPGKMIAPGISGVNFSQDGKLVFYNLPYYEGTAVAGIESAIYQVPVLGGMTKKLADKVPLGALLSSDGQHLAFPRRVADEIQLLVADVGGANERVLATRKIPQLIFPGAWSPDGQTLACVSSAGDGSTTGNIVLFNLADGLEKPLTTAKGWFFRSNMKWLPDGSGLIFGAREQQAGLDQLWHVSYPGGEVRRITTDLASYTGVSLSADGGMLVTTQIDQPLNIWIVPEGDSSRPKPITSGRHFIGGLSWTVDHRIVYSSGDVTPQDISVVAPDGSGQQILAAGSDSAGYTLPSVSPDGRYIVFVSNGRVGRMDVDGGNQRALTTSGPFAQNPQVTPDGQWVIYSTNEQRNPRLYKVSVNGGEPVQISDKLIWRPQVSPDGSQIACLYHERWNEPYKIAILPLAGGEPIKIFDPTSGPGRLLRWSHDGRAIYFTDEREGISNIWRLPVDTDGPATQISNFTEGVIRSFAWSRDGKLLAVSRGVPSSDVVLITEFK